MRMIFGKKLNLVLGTLMLIGEYFELVKMFENQYQLHLLVGLIMV